MYLCVHQKYSSLLWSFRLETIKSNQSFIKHPVFIISDMNQHVKSCLLNVFLITDATICNKSLTHPKANDIQQIHKDGKKVIKHKKKTDMHDLFKILVQPKTFILLVSSGLELSCDGEKKVLNGCRLLLRHAVY